jgi:hypothetical protein
MHTDHALLFIRVPLGIGLVYKTTKPVQPLFLCETILKVEIIRKPVQ